MPRISLATTLTTTALLIATGIGITYGLRVHHALEQFTSGQLSIDQHLTQPIVVGPSTLLKADTAERLMLDGRVPFCDTWCFRAVFKKAHQYFQVDFELHGTSHLTPLYVNELYETQVKELLLKDDPLKFRAWFGEPQEL